MTKYISLESVLFDMSTMMDEQFWDENKMLEWATMGYRKMSTGAKYMQKVAIIPIIEHKGTVPTDMKHLTQIAYKPNISDIDLETIKQALGLDSCEESFVCPDALVGQVASLLYQQNRWLPMLPAGNSFFKSTGKDYEIPESLGATENSSHNLGASCGSEYHIDPNGCITTSIRKGLIAISYLGFATDNEGTIMIPDEANLRDALYHWCMYRYWESRSNSKDEAAHRERAWHLRRYSVLSPKASAKLNSPDIGTLESLLNSTRKMIKKSNRFDNFYSNLNTPDHNVY